MVVEYDHESHWTILLQLHGSALPRSAKRCQVSVLMSILATTLQYCEVWQGNPGLSLLYQGTGLIIGLIMSFRLSHSYSKWSAGVEAVTQLANASRNLVAMMCGYIKQPDKKLQIEMTTFRRKVILMCVLLMKHVREDKDLHDIVKKGLLTVQEGDVFVNQKLTYSGDDPKKDRFPTKARVALVCQECRKMTTEWLHAGIFAAPHQWNQMEGQLNDLMKTFEGIEILKCSQLPFPYAQYIKLQKHLYTLLFPWGVVSTLGLLTPVASFIISMVFFTIDEIAVELEDPFGADANDLDLEKRVRRIDKETACLMAIAFGKEVPNYNLFPECDSNGHQLQRQDTERLYGRLY